MCSDVSALLFTGRGGEGYETCTLGPVQAGPWGGVGGTSRPGPVWGKVTLNK